MIKIILFDCDGLIIRHEKYFSLRLAERNGLYLADENKEQKEFFNNLFLKCIIGQADLKVELGKNLGLWDWQGTVEELMKFWFSGEVSIDQELKAFILNLRKNSFRCFLSTNNEKYRAEYLWSVVGLKDVFDGIYASAYVGHSKKDKLFWDNVYKNFPNNPKEDILVWDDDSSNVKTVKEFGFNAEFYSDFALFKNIMAEKYNIHA
jgi:FMN phosphatase YigB (HAD superfamily)